METNLYYINLICTDLGGVGGHFTNLAGENEICTLLGGTGGHFTEVAALNEICTIQGVTAGHSHNLAALNAISGVSNISNLVGWKYIQSAATLNYTYGDVTTINKNKFNKATYVDAHYIGWGVSYGDASSKHSAAIAIDELVGLVCISGLTPYTGSAGQLCWFTANMTYITYVSMPASSSTFSAVPPINAKFFIFSICQQKTGAEVINLDTIQCEWWAVTAYEAYGTTTVYVPVDESNLPLFVPTAGKNKFNKNKILLGYRDNSSVGGYTAKAASASTYLMPVPSDAKFVYLSGMSAYTGADKAIVFYTSAKAFISAKSVTSTVTDVCYALPANTAFVSQQIYNTKSAGTINLDTLQIEFYGETAYEAYSETSQNRLLFPKHDTKTWGKSVLVFGNSIMETCLDWTTDGATYTEGGRQNWITFAVGYLKTGTFKNYAASGGRWQDQEQATRLKASTQITTAIANIATTDIIIIDLGVNDIITANLGDFATAMGKATLADLDRSKFYEAVRWGMWSLRTAYPDAKCFAGNVLQTATVENAVFADRNTAIQLMCAEYGFVYVDQMNESGVDRNNETVGANGVDLVDGLHPNHHGWLKLGRFWETKILAQF